MQKLWNKKAPIILLVVPAVIAVIIFAIFLRAERQKAQAALINSVHTPINLSVDSVQAPLDTPEAMCTAPLVAEVVVNGHGLAHWNTGEGALPSGITEMMVDNDGYEVLTPVKFASINPLLDKRAASTTEFDLLGGQVGLDSMTFDSPNLQKLSRYVAVFVPTYQVEEKAYTQSVLEIAAAFSVTDDGEVILKPQHTEQGRISQQEQAISLKDLATQLLACK